MFWSTILLPIILVLLYKTFFIVSQQHPCIVERLGRFVRVASPGLNFKIPFIETIAGEVNLRVRQLDVEVETKTLDDVFLQIVASVQYRILPNKISSAFYVLDNAEGQIQSFVFDVIRARVPMIKLDDVFSKKDEIADAVKTELQEVMNEFGYDIIKALVTDINPNAKVKSAMNEINEAQRLRIAANERGEAEKILKVKQAEAESQSKILQGQGVAGQRRAILEGLKASLDDLQKNIPGTDVMSLVLMVQYFDTLKEMSMHGNLNTILLPHSPSGLQDLYQQIRTAIITGNQVSEIHKK